MGNDTWRFSCEVGYGIILRNQTIEQLQELLQSSCNIYYKKEFTSCYGNYEDDENTEDDEDDSRYEGDHLEYDDEYKYNTLIFVTFDPIQRLSSIDSGSDMHHCIHPANNAEFRVERMNLFSDPVKNKRLDALNTGGVAGAYISYQNMPRYWRKLVI